MKNALRTLLLVILLNVVANAKATNDNPSSFDGNNSDTSISLKSNILIFKIINTTSPVIQNSDSNRALKKAGKVARTSNSHSSLDEFPILYKRKGI